MKTAAAAIAEVRAAVEARLGRESFAHCERVSETAARLARAYGVDPEEAALAGMLHDWHRDATDEELVAAAARSGLAVDPVEIARPYLLHAGTAAAEARTAFPGLSDQVAAAVEAHTLGAVGMSDLAKVVYVADMIEPARAWDGVEELRSAVGNVGLDELFLRAYQRTLEHLVAKRKRIHPRTLEVWDSLVGKVRP